MTCEIEAQAELFFEAARRKLLADIVSAGWIGKRIGPYRLVAEVACGGMGAVYVAERDDGQFSKRVAVKLVRPGFIDACGLARFRRERQVLAKLEHPYIARLLDAGETDDGAPYMVMEYVEGKPITEYCAGRQASLTERLSLFRKVCAAVAYAHARCVAHCDLKPGNILVTPEGDPKLIDFGIAKLFGSTGAASTPASVISNTGLLTPDYASPEQTRGEAVTTATDVYSLGAVLYELLTSERPHRISSYSRREVKRAVCDISHGEVPRGKGLDRILLTALAKEPQDRYESVEDFSEDVSRYQAGQQVRASYRSLLCAITRKARCHRTLALSLAAILTSGSVTFVASRRQWTPDAVSTPARQHVIEVLSDDRLTSVPKPEPPVSTIPVTGGAPPNATERDERRILYRPAMPARQWVTEATPEDLRRLIPELEHAIQAVAEPERSDNSVAAANVLAENIVTIAHIGAGEPSLVFRGMGKPGHNTSSFESRLANGHTTLGYARLGGQWDWHGAEHEFREAIRLDPNLVRALGGYAHLLMKANRRAEAALIVQRLSGREQAFTGVTLLEAQLRYNTRDYTGVVADLETLVGRTPGYARAHYLLALGYGHLNQFDRALVELDKAALLPEIHLSNKAWLYGNAGRTDEGERILSSCRQLGGDCLMGLIGLRRNEEAFAVLQKALARRAPVLLNLQSDPRFDPIRDDARFADLMQQVGFALANLADNDGNDRSVQGKRETRP